MSGKRLVGALIGGGLVALTYYVVRRKRRRVSRPGEGGAPVAQRRCVVDGCDVYYVEGSESDGVIGLLECESSCAVGLDVEWSPTHPAIATVQIASASRCVVARVVDGALGEATRAFLESRVCAGVGVHEDARKMKRDLDVDVSRCADLRVVARERCGYPKGARDGLAALAMTYAPSASLPHKVDESVRRGDWRSPHLSLKQIEYAAGDAIASYKALV